MRHVIAVALTGLVFFINNPAWAESCEAMAETLTVDQAVSLALSRHPAVTEADERIEAAKASVSSSRASWYPRAKIDYSFSDFRAPHIMKQGGAEIQTAHQTLYNWDVTVIQPLFTGFARSAGVNLAKLDLESRRMEKEQTVLDLTLSVKSACYNLILAQRLEEVSNQETDALAAHQRDAELFFKEGLIRPNDLLQARVALAHSVQQRERARAETSKAGVHLNSLLNRPLDSPVDVLDIAGTIQFWNEPDAAQLDEQALTQRPLMKLLDISLKQLDHSLILAKSPLYPTVSLVGQYEQSGDSFEANHNDYTNDHNASVTVQASWTFFQGGKVLSESRKVKGQIRALKAGIERHRNQIKEEVHSAFLDCRTASNNIETASKALDQARENWRTTDLQYKQQVATATDVLDARAFLTQADSNYYRAVYGYLNAVAALDRAAGGKIRRPK